MLDVSWVVQDPMLADQFSVTRRVETVGTDGRVIMATSNFPNLIGVVTQSDPSSLVRNDDSQTIPRVISVVSKFNFRSATDGFQPDLIIWNGTTYLVKTSLPYSRYGAGFYEAIASSMTAIDVPQ
jgi:hypothetical protein